MTNADLVWENSIVGWLSEKPSRHSECLHPKCQKCYKSHSICNLWLESAMKLLNVLLCFSLHYDLQSRNQLLSGLGIAVSLWSETAIQNQQTRIDWFDLNTASFQAVQHQKENQTRACLEYQFAHELSSACPHDTHLWGTLKLEEGERAEQDAQRSSCRGTGCGWKLKAIL